MKEIFQISENGTAASSHTIYIYLKLDVGKFSAQATPTVISCKEKIENRN